MWAQRSGRAAAGAGARRGAEAPRTLEHPRSTGATSILPRRARYDLLMLQLNCAMAKRAATWLAVEAAPAAAAMETAPVFERAV